MTNKTKKQESVLREVTGASDFEERRKTARLDIPLKVSYNILENSGRTTDDEPRTTEKKAVTKDVSLGGCLLLVQEELPIDSVVEIKLFLGKKEDEALILNGKVARLNRKEKKLFEYGIAFDGMSAEARRLFADFCFAKMYEMIGLTQWPTDRGQKK